MDQVTPQQFAKLQREVAALRAQVGRRRRLGRARAVALGLALVALLALSPLAALAANFTDLNPGSPHNANINAIADAGISLGCNPAGTQYCPNQLVTREQMASFLARTAGLGTNPPIANAATAQTAVNAAQLGGLPASAYLQAGGDVVVPFNGSQFITADANVTLTSDANTTVSIQATTATTKNVQLPLNVPLQSFGVPLKFKSVQVCYRTLNAANFITTTQIIRPTGSFSSAVLAQDGTNQASISDACYTFTPTNPVAITEAVFLRLVLTFTNTTDEIRIYQVVVTMTP